LVVKEESSLVDEMNSMPNPFSGPVNVDTGLPMTGFELRAAAGRFRLRNLVTFAGGLAIIALLLAKFEWRTTIEVLKHSSLPLVAISAAAYSIFLFLRAVRWAIILRGRVNFLALLIYSYIGTLISFVTAAQAGEFVKPALVRTRHGVPYFVTAASVAVERLLDIATLVVMGLFGLLALPTRMLGPAWITTGLKVGGLFCVLGFLVLGFGSRWADEVLGIISKLLFLVRLPAPVTEGILRIMRAFLHGAGAALSPASLACAMLCSVALWGFNVASVAIVFRAVNRPIGSIPVVLLGFTVLSCGVAVPMIPGCVGQYEGLWLVAFAALHVGPEGAVLAAGLLSHGLTILTIAFFGLLSFGFLRLRGGSGGSPNEWRKFEKG
jgi:uncharacterized protein (TIRG00374 family)